MDKYTGKRLDGRYEIHELVGVGGMAWVYRGYDLLEQRVVAVKILKDEFLHNAEFIRRFKNESKAIALLSHPNIIKVYDVSFGDQIQYIVEEFIDGITLRQYLDQQTKVNLPEAVHFTMEILDALQHAHARGIVHRDIKPQNIMVLPNGHIIVTDFGIARFARSETRTMTDKAIGSVHYIAPEQARGDLTDEKADIYSVGVMLYEMTPGQLPFEAENAVSVAIMQLQNDPRPPRDINPNIPRGLEEITLKAMQKDPAQRYQSAGEMLEALRALVQNPGITFNYNYFVDDTPTRYIAMDDSIRSDGQNPYGDDYGYTEEGETPERPAHKKKKRNKIPFIITGIAAAFAVVLICLAFAGVFRSCSTQTVTLDNFVGRLLEDVQNNNPNHFQFVIVADTDSEEPEGTITNQNPQAGTQVEAGASITLEVAQSSDETTVPDIRNQTREQAQSTLEQNGLVARFEEQADDDVEEGHVISVSPEVGSPIQRGETVTVQISTGPEEITVPNVVGDTLSAATQALEAEGFVVDSQPQDDTGKDENIVVSTTPAAGTSGKKGDTVTVYYSSGKNEKTIQIVIPLPSNVSHDVALRYYLDGEQAGSATVNPSYNNTWTHEITGSNTQTLTVELDGQQYATYRLDFNAGSYSLTWQGSYVDQQTPSQPPQSQPESEPDSSQPETPSTSSEPADPLPATSSEGAEP